MQADRLLRDMHKLCCHDLPNQVVIAQTLVELLAEDEADRLSEDGLEYVRRLKNSLGAANEMTRVLRELVKLSAYEAAITQIEWAILTRDWRSKIAARFAEFAIATNCTWGVSTALGDARALTHVVLEFVGLVRPVDSDRLGIELHTEDRAKTRIDTMRRGKTDLSPTCHAWSADRFRVN